MSKLHNLQAVSDIPVINFGNVKTTNNNKNPSFFNRSSKSKEMYDNPQTNPYVIMLARKYKDQLVLNVIDKDVHLDLSKNIMRKLQKLEDMFKEQVLYVEK